MHCLKRKTVAIRVNQPEAYLEQNLTGALQLGSQVCALGAPLLGGPGACPPGNFFKIKVLKRHFLLFSERFRVFLNGRFVDI